MAENLKITTPVTSGDRTMQVKGNKNATPIGNIDPTKVLSKNPAAESSAKNNNLIWNNTSSFQLFFDKLMKTPDLSETLGKLVNGTLGEIANGSVKTGTDNLLSNLAQSSVMDPNQMLENILFQQKNMTSFNSEIFDVLRDISSHSDDETLNLYIGRFLKAYDGVFTAPATMKSISDEINQSLQYIPKSFADPVRNEMQNLSLPLNDDNIESNLTILKDKVLPLLGKYVATFNDFGAVRDKISLIVHNLSRLNVSSKADLEKSYNELLSYFRYNENIPSDKLNAIKTMMEQAIHMNKDTNNKFIDSLANVLATSGRGNPSDVSQTMIQDTLQSLLLDYSVYMPFMHMFLPINYNGQSMFTDIWVEKDGETSSPSNNSRMIYIKFNIKNVGDFQTSIMYSKDSVNCQINLPESLRGKIDTVNRDVKVIFSSNGFADAKVSSAVGEPNVLLDITKKINERRSTVDVTV